MTRSPKCSGPRTHIQIRELVNARAGWDLDQYGSRSIYTYVYTTAEKFKVRQHDVHHNWCAGMLLQALNCVLSGQKVINITT